MKTLTGIDTMLRVAAAAKADDIAEPESGSGS